jgi:hypothetical protein
LEPGRRARSDPVHGERGYMELGPGGANVRVPQLGRGPDRCPVSHVCSINRLDVILGPCPPVLPDGVGGYADEDDGDQTEDDITKDPVGV